MVYNCSVCPASTRDDSATTLRRLSWSSTHPLDDFLTTFSAVHRPLATAFSAVHAPSRRLSGSRTHTNKLTFVSLLPLRRCDVTGFVCYCFLPNNLSCELRLRGALFERYRYYCRGVVVRPPRERVNDNGVQSTRTVLATTIWNVCHSADGCEKMDNSPATTAANLLQQPNPPFLGVNAVHGFGARNAPAFAALALRVQLHQLHRFVRFARCASCCLETSTFPRSERTCR